GLEVVAEQIAQAEVLVVAEILAAAEQQPTGLLEDRGARPSRFMRLVHGRCPVPCSYWRRCGSGRGYAEPRSSFRGSASDRVPTSALALRSDCIGMLEERTVPALVQYSNWQEVPPFTEPAARRFRVLAIPKVLRR